MDLQPIAHNHGRIEGGRKLIEPHTHSTGSGLASLSKSILNVVINKDHKVRCGNWEAAQLSPAQTEYAAIDAWVLLLLFFSDTQ